jgi:Myb/SANT-like DNA-binding domain
MFMFRPSNFFPRSLLIYLSAPQETSEHQQLLEVPSAIIPHEGFAVYGDSTYDDLGRVVTLGDIPATEDKLSGEMKKITTLSTRKRKSPVKPINENDTEKKDEGSCKWSEKAFSALVDAKVVELNRLLDKSEAKFHMLRVDLKWQEIAKFMSSTGFNYTATQCKHKWGTEHKLYKKVSDYQNFSGRENYFTMEPQDRKKNGLPPNFCEERFMLMDSALKDRANIKPPGIRDSSRQRNAKVSPSKKTSLSDSSSCDSVPKSKGDDTDVVEQNGSGDDFTTSYSKKQKECGKPKKPKFKDDTKNIVDIEAILDKVMRAAAVEQKTNLSILVEAGHEDVKTMASLMQQLIDKN